MQKKIFYVATKHFLVVSAAASSVSHFELFSGTQFFNGFSPKTEANYQGYFDSLISISPLFSCFLFEKKIAVKECRYIAKHDDNDHRLSLKKVLSSCFTATSH